MMHDRAVWVVLAALLSAGCGGGGPEPAALEPAMDLLAELPAAEVQREARRFELGSDWGEWSEGVTVAGFSSAHAPEGFRWSQGPSSEVTFFLAERRGMPMTFRAFPFRYPEAPDQEVEVVLNGRRVDRVEIDPGTHEYEVDLPRRAVRAGENRLAFRYAYAAAPSEVAANGSDDSRSLAMAWEWVQLDAGVEGGADGGGRARARRRGRARDQDGLKTTRDELYLPYGTRVSYYLALPRQAALLLDGLVERGGEGRLDVRVQLEGEEERVAGVLAPGDGARAVALSEDGGMARVSLTALPGERPIQPSRGLVLRRPAVAVPRAAAAGGQASPAAAAVPEAPADEAAAVPASETAAEPRGPVNVLVYMVDTLRADRLGVYGFDRPVSPRLDAFAADATVFETAIAQSPWTRPSVASVLTGLTPLVHGINRPRDGLSQEAVTLAELLSAHGYRTAAMVANPNIAGRFNLGQGFDSYELLGGFDNGAPLVTDWARQWLDEQRDPERPFFLYLHTVEPHAPYTPEEEFRARFAPDVPRNGFGTQPHIRSLKKEDGSLTDEVVGWLLDLYDAEIAANDAAFGDLLDVLEARGLLDDTVVVFVSDHGEEFMEHGRLEHAKTFYREVIEVPLVVRFPDLGHGRRIAAPVQHVDVMPTLLGYLGVAQPPGLEGRDLTPWVAGEEPSPEDVAATEIHSYLDRRGYRGASVRVGDWRYVDMRAPRPSEELYDLPRDPAEKADVDERHPVRAGWMESRIRLYRHHAESGQLQPTVEHLDKELRERLRALGYI